MVTVARIRSASVGAMPVVGSGVTSPTVKTPNCMPDIGSPSPLLHSTRYWSRLPGTSLPDVIRQWYLPAMSSLWPALDLSAWSATCDTLHAHTQILGKLAVVLAPPEPQLQHAALRLTARGWETAPLPAPDGSGTLVVALDLHHHDVVAEHSDGQERRVALAPNRPVADVTRGVLSAVADLV